MDKHYCLAIRELYTKNLRIIIRSYDGGKENYIFLPYGVYALPYWRGKGDKETLEKTEKYYAECEEAMEKKPLGTKAEDNWGETRQKKRGKTKQKGKVKDTQEKDAADMRSSLTVCVCTEHASECKTDEGRAGPEDHDNHCG